MRMLMVPFVLLLAAPDTGAGPVRTPRFLQKEVTVAAPVERVWHAWTTAEGLTFVSAKSNVELRVGGPYEWFLDLEPDEQGKRGGEGAKVLMFTEHKMLRFTWTFPPSIPTLRNAGKTTDVEVHFEPTADGGTHVRFLQSGWGEGEDWDAGYDYFDRAWDYVLDQLAAKLGDSPE